MFRGTEDYPGCVATLVPAVAAAPCWGVAYTVPRAQKAATLAYLDEREKQGFDRALVPIFVHTDDASGADGLHSVGHALLYVATQHNEHFWHNTTPEVV